MNRNRRTSREAIDSILPISDLNRLESDFQYLEKKQIKQWQKYKRKMCSVIGCSNKSSNVTCSNILVSLHLLRTFDGIVIYLFMASYMLILYFNQWLTLKILWGALRNNKINTAAGYSKYRCYEKSCL